MPSFLRYQDTQAASTTTFSSMLPFSRPSTPSPTKSSRSGNKALKLVRSLSIPDIPKKFKRSKKQLPPLPRQPISSPVPAIPQLPPLVIHKASDNDNVNAPDFHFDAMEFLTLDPEPWVGVSVTSPSAQQDDFGLLPSEFRLTRQGSLLSLYSCYSRRSYEGGHLPSLSDRQHHHQVPSSPESILADLQEQEDDQALHTPMDTPSSSRSSSRLAGSQGGGYVTHHTYLPEFRNSIIMMDKPAPPRPPRRNTSTRRHHHNHSHHQHQRSSSSLHRGNSSRSGSESPRQLPLLSRRLTSNSSTTSLSHSLRGGGDGSMRSVLAACSSGPNESTTDLVFGFGSSRYG